jgi:hypothetical protein
MDMNIAFQGSGTGGGGSRRGGGTATARGRARKSTNVRVAVRISPAGQKRIAKAAKKAVPRTAAYGQPGSSRRLAVGKKVAPAKKAVAPAKRLRSTPISKPTSIRSLTPHQRSVYRGFVRAGVKPSTAMRRATRTPSVQKATPRNPGLNLTYR